MDTNRCPRERYGRLADWIQEKLRSARECRRRSARGADTRPFHTAWATSRRDAVFYFARSDSKSLHQWPPTAAYTRGHYVLTVISTLRFFCRPSGSSAPLGLVFGATGLVLPKPRAFIRVLMPFSASQRRIDSARRSESLWLY